MKQLNKRGFTIIELLVFIVILVALAAVAVANVRGLRADGRDETRKTDINAIYYQLEAFYEKNSYYPEKLDASSLQGIDPESLKDENNLAPNDPDSSYSYTPSGCKESKCTGYELSTKLEREATYTKVGLNN